MKNGPAVGEALEWGGKGRMAWDALIDGESGGGWVF